MASPTSKELVTLRLPHAVMEEVRTIAAREEETQSAVIRRLLRERLGAHRMHEPGGAFIETR